jgi:hypothetical protein
VELKLGHHRKDGIEVVTVQGEIDTCTAPRPRELLLELAAKGGHQIVINLDKAALPEAFRIARPVSAVFRTSAWRDAAATRLSGGGTEAGPRH